MARSVEDLFRPSNLEKLLACPASASREAAFDDPGSPAAQEGTAAHAFAASALAARCDAAEYIGQVFDGVTCTPEMADAIQVYIDHVRTLSANYTRTHLIETEVKLDPLMLRKGTVDCAVLDGNTIHVIDFKYGIGVPVSPEGNPQLRAYAQGLIDKWEPMIEGDVLVQLHIVQPRITRSPKIWEDDWRDLMKFEQEVRAAIKKAKSPAAPYGPGPHCRFCLVRKDCEALNGFVQDATSRPPPLSDPDAIAEALQRVEAVRIWAKAVEAAALDLLNSGVPVAGWKLVAGRGDRAWTKDADVIAHAKKKRLPVDDFQPRELRSVAQLEKALGKARFVELGFPLFTARSDGAPTLAPASDPRQAIKSVAEQFDVVDVDDPLYS